MDYLVFRLYGHLASWGKIAVGESRHTSDHPSKSALLGLLGASLGLKRDEDDKQKALRNGLRLAVKVISPGTFLNDYHTSQVPPVGKRKFRTRREEIFDGKKLSTILSGREYRTDSLQVIAVKIDADNPECLPESAEMLKQKLLKPIFVLYLGRKSCPLALPMAPQIIRAKGFKDALDKYRHQSFLPSREENFSGIDAYFLKVRPKKKNGHENNPAEKMPHDYFHHARYYWEGSNADFSGDDPKFQKEKTILFTQRDQPLSRTAWQFESRIEKFYQT